MYYNNIEMLGLFAAFCTSIAFLPQVMKVYRMRSVNDLSLSMYIIYTLGVVAWTIYGFYIQSFPVVIGNIVSMIFSTIILYFKLQSLCIQNSNNQRI